MTPSLNDKLMLQDCLTSLKETSSLYNVSAQESANKQLKDEYLNIHRKVQENITKVFDTMNSKGWYQVKPADQQSIEMAKNTANTVETGFSSIK